MTSISGSSLRSEELRDVPCYGDDSQLPTPDLFFYAQGMPVVLTRNQFIGLKLVNGTPFRAVDTFRLWYHCPCQRRHIPPQGPAAVLLQSDDIADLAIPWPP